MTSSRQLVERRKQKRFGISKDVFVVLNPNFIKVGKIKNISMDGLAFSYVGNEVSSTETRELDVFTGNRAFHLHKVPCRIVSDLKIRQTLSGLTMRRCSVEFGELASYQIARLEYFIQNYTAGEVV